jgi:hypothetical protein
MSIIFGMLAASCMVLAPQLRLVGVAPSSESVRKTDLVVISVQPTRETSGPGNGNSPGYNGHDRITGFNVVFRNTTNNPVFIVWEKSSLKYGNGTFVPFVQGQEYENFSRPMAAMVIPPNGTMRKYIYSSQQPYKEPGNHGGWKMLPIEADAVVLVFCVQSKDIEDYYTIAVQ